MAAADPRVRTVDTDTFEINARDEIHFTADGYWDIGLGMAREMAYLLWVGDRLTVPQIDSGEGEPTADPDGDGLFNDAEFNLGTDVGDANARFKLDLETIGPDTFQLSFPSITGREYIIDSRIDLTEGTWQPIGSFTEGADAMEMTPINTNEPHRFFRVRSRLPE